MKLETVKEWAERYTATGRCAFVHPRKKTISLNGGKAMPFSEGVKQIRECLNV